MDAERTFRFVRSAWICAGSDIGTEWTKAFAPRCCDAELALALEEFKGVGMSYAKQQRWCRTAAALLYLLLAVVLLYRFQLYPSAILNTDALAYVGMGREIRQTGVLNPPGLSRTYGYPLLVAFYSVIGGNETLSIALVAGIFQSSLYGFFVFWLAAIIWPDNPKLANATIIGLLLNPIVVAIR